VYDINVFPAITHEVVMKRNKLIVAFSALALLFTGTLAYAADDDEVACEGKAAGDACTDEDGEAGTCQMDAEDDALECEEGAPGAPDDDEAACEGKAEGDVCTDDDGEEGTCEIDSDDGALECED
jgi:hypothetical protein